MGKKDLDNMDNTRTKLNQKLSTRIPLELRLLRYMDNKDNTFNKNKKKTVVHRPQSRIPLAYFKKFITKSFVSFVHSVQTHRNQAPYKDSYWTVLTIVSIGSID